MKQELKNVKVYDLDWSTSSLSVDQKLAMGKAAASMVKEKLATKEENAEMKEFDTREPDFLIKGEDREMKDIPFRVPPSEEVPDAVLEGMQDVVVAAADSST